MRQALEIPGILSLAAGFTDNAALPDDLIGISLQNLRNRDSSRSFLQYGTTPGRDDLRERAIAHVRDMPSETFSLEAADALITNGSQQALYLAVQTLCDPGDMVLVERPSYFVFLEMLRGLGVRPLSIPADEDGNYDLAALESLLNELETQGELPKLKAAYLCTYHANPSGRCRPQAEKEALGETFHRLVPQLAILEDGAYRDLYFENPTEAPCVLSLNAFAELPCLYFGTFTKPFATGLKVGFALGNHRGWLKRMSCVKGHQDFGTAHLNQCLVHEMLRAGYYPRHLARMRAHYRGKCLMMEAALHGSGLREAGWEWQAPEGGLLIWLSGPSGTDTGMKSALCQRALEAKVLYVPGDLCFGDHPESRHVRLSFGAIAETDIPEAVRRFANAALT